MCCFKQRITKCTSQWFPDSNWNANSQSVLSLSILLSRCIQFLLVIQLISSPLFFTGIKQACSISLARRKTSSYLLFVDSATCLFIRVSLAEQVPPPLAVRYIQSASASSPATSFTRPSQPFKEKQEYCQLQIDSMLKLFSNEEETSVFAYFLLLPPLHWHFRLVVAATTGRFISPAVCLLCFLSLLH